MPLAKHKITGNVVELTCEQLKNPDYANLFEEVEGERLCTDCTLPELPVETKEEKPVKAPKNEKESVK